MHWSVVVPGALVPAPIAADVIAAARAPHLFGLVARARSADARWTSPSTQGAAHLGWLWQRFSGRDDIPVTAPYAWRALSESAATEDAPDGVLWHADPVHFALARDHMLLAALDDLDPAEAMALAAEADTCAGAAGARVRIVDRHWFVRFGAPCSLQATPLEAALGGSVQQLLPQGDDSLHWRRLLNEIQIVWHQHPVNAAREQRGAREVNGLWLHGGGTHQALPASGLAQLASTDPVLRGWALAAGLPPASIVDEAAGLSDRGDALTVWPDLFAACRAQDWGQWLSQLARFDQWLAALSQRAFAANARVQLVLCGCHQTRSVLAGRNDRWRLWRRRPASAVMSEQEAPT